MTRSSRHGRGAGGGKDRPRDSKHDKLRVPYDRGRMYGNVIHHLEDKQRQMNKQLAKKDTKIAELEKEHREDVALQTQSEQLLTFGTSALRDQRAKGAALQTENERLRERVLELEEANGRITDMVTPLPAAMGDEWTGLALEAQAQRTLSMVNGLQGEVAEKDANIKQLRAALAKQDATITAKDRKEAELAEKMKSQARERQEAAQDQQKLIYRLLAENERLGGDFLQRYLAERDKA